MKQELEPALILARELALDELPEFLGSLEEVRVIAMARLAAPAPVQQADELLNVESAAARLGVSEDYVYRHARDFAFTRRIGRRLLFSALGIERHIRQQSVMSTARDSGIRSRTF